MAVPTDKSQNRITVLRRALRGLKLSSGKGQSYDHLDEMKHVAAQRFGIIKIQRFFFVPFPEKRQKSLRNN